MAGKKSTQQETDQVEGQEEKKSKLQVALEKMEKDFGKGSYISGDQITHDLEVVDTGSIYLNVATKCGGFPVGKLIEIQGMESSGKSTGTLHAIKSFQQLAGVCVLCDYEQSFDRTYAEAIGVDVDKLLILQPDTLEDGYNMIERLVDTGEVRLAVIDSHTAGMPRKVVDGDVGDQSVGMQARINSQALGKLKPKLKANRCTVIGISQIRQDIGSMGEVNKSTGGLSWKFYSDMRIKFAKILTEKDKESNKTEITVFKNKCAAPWGKAVIHIEWGKGYDTMQEVIDIGCELEVIKKAGSWYSYNDSKLGQGSDAVKQLFTDNPELYKDIEQIIREKLK